MKRRWKFQSRGPSRTAGDCYFWMTADLTEAERKSGYLWLVHAIPVATFWPNMRGTA